MEDDKLDLAKELLAQFGEKLVLPVDHVVAAELKEGAENEDVVDIPAGKMGSTSARRPSPLLRRNYRHGEDHHLERSHGRVRKAAFRSRERWRWPSGGESGAVSVVGGGDSEKAIKSAGVTDKISHVSTGGGASLEFLSGQVLPGVAALTEK